MQDQGRRCPHCLSVAPKTVTWPMRIIRILQDWEDEAYENLTSEDHVMQVQATRHARRPAEIRHRLCTEIAQEEGVEVEHASKFLVPNPRAFRQICLNMKQANDLEASESYIRGQAVSGLVLAEHLYRAESAYVASKQKDLDAGLWAIFADDPSADYGRTVAALSKFYHVDLRAARDVITRALQRGQIWTNDMETLWRKQ